MNALGQFLTRRPRGPRHAGDETAMPANAAPSPDSPATVPPAAPTFTPTLRNLAETRPFAAPGPRTARGTHARTTRRHVQQDDGTLRRVRNGLRDLPDAPLSREEQFAADMRAPRKGGLPIFRSVAASKLGWCGLNEEYLPLARTDARSIVPWHEQARDAIDSQFAAAQAELRGTVAEQDRYEARVRDAADAALALGYPGSAL